MQNTDGRLFVLLPRACSAAATPERAAVLNELLWRVLSTIGADGTVWPITPYGDDGAIL
jgi:hypothetical protein